MILSHHPYASSLTFGHSLQKQSRKCTNLLLEILPCEDQVQKNGLFTAPNRSVVCSFSIETVGRQFSHGIVWLWMRANLPPFHDFSSYQTQWQTPLICFPRFWWPYPAELSSVGVGKGTPFKAETFRVCPLAETPVWGLSRHGYRAKVKGAAHTTSHGPVGATPKRGLS